MQKSYNIEMRRLVKAAAVKDSNYSIQDKFDDVFVSIIFVKYS
jgi:hypothetical protein